MFLIITKNEDVDVEPFKHLSTQILSVRDVESNPIQIENYKAIIILGGDGTILRLIQNYKSVPPIIAVNYGTLGFLTNFDKMDFKNVQANFEIENMKTNTRNRLLLTNEKHEKIYFLNEAVLTTRKRRLNTFCINVNNKLKNFIVKADSLIISTMTGSTAYNHSVFGPTLLNDDSFVINLVAPNKSNFRPLVCNLNDDVTITSEDHGDALCIVDGKEFNFGTLKVKYDGNFVSFLSKQKIRGEINLKRFLQNKFLL